VKQGSEDHQDLQVRVDHAVLTENLDLEDLQGHLDSQVHQENPDCEDLTVLPEKLDLEGLPDLPDQ